MRTIVHLDADAFFASVEQAANASLRGKPVAVGGERRGIIASASYEARAFGVHTPMSTARARKLCPKLIVLPGDFERYEQFSNWMFGYAYDFTPAVEQTSIDEGYFDLTANRQRSPTEIAQTIRHAIRQSLKISVSEGLGSNKLVSQIASKLHKPAAFTAVPAGGEISFLHPLPTYWLPGIGPNTATRLNAAGLAQIRHVAATPLELLELLLGKVAVSLKEFANGHDDRPLIPTREPAKSFSQQETFAQDLTDAAYLEAVLRRMADNLFAKVRAERKSIRTLTVKVRYNDMAEDQCSESLVEPTDLETDVYGRLSLMLRQAWKRRVSLRLVSLKLSNVYDGVFRSELPLETPARQHEARERLALVVDELRRAKGTAVLLRGHDFTLRLKPDELTEKNPKSEIRNPKKARNAKSEPEPVAQVSQPAVAPAARSAGYASAPAPQVWQPATQRTWQSALQGLVGVRAHSATYIPLRVRSHYSFLDSTLSPAAIVALAKEHGCSAVALTDFGNLHGAVEFTLAARQAGIKPILGAEIRAGGLPLLLYVESVRGYANLCRLLSAANRARPSSSFSSSKRSERIEDEDDGRGRGRTEGKGERLDCSVADFHRRNFSREDLVHFTEGLLAVSSDARLADLFPGRFYQAASPADVAAARQSAAYFGSESSDGGALPSRRYESFPIVPCPAIHYATPEDRLKFDIVQSIRTRTLLRQAHPAKRLDGRFHFRTSAEMQAACKVHPDWLAHTHEIADRCTFELSFGQPQFPAYHTPDGSTSRAFLRRLVHDGFQHRYHGRRIVSDTGAEVPLAQVRAQIETELAIIAEVGYEDLFLITWDLLQTCRARGIEWITRGSAADSLVCYCLGISDVCPIRFGLYFRRFLNKERMAMNKLPDIDVDFPHDRKDEVVDLLFAKYGPEHCAVVGGFSTFQARSAVGDVAKVLGVSEYQIRRFTEHFPWSFGGGWIPVDELRPRGNQLLELLRASPECRDLPLDEEPFKTAVETAAFLDGVPRHPKMHPCGVVVSRQPMHELTPTFISNKGWPTTHFDMDAVEAIGLVKMDILAQGGLAVMRDAKEMLAARGVEVDLEKFVANGRPLQNPKSEIRNPKETRNSKSEIGSPKSETGSSELGEGRTATSAGTRSAGCSTCRIADSPIGRPPNLAPPAGVETCAPADLAVCATNPQSADEASSGFQISDFELPSDFGFRISDFTPANLSTDPFNDPAVWSMIASGGARAVHHIESPAMTSLCRMCNVREIDGLIAIVSVIRPGAANEQKKVKFTRRYQGMEPPEYPHPSLEACLRSTFGLVVYEEHILQICEAFAGMNPGRADVLRRALVKQNRRQVSEMAAEFFVSARARGHDDAKIQEVWELVTGFNGYAFCKAHSTAYGVEAYQAAWLKCHFPAEFMAAVLTNGKGFYDPLVYVLECHRLGIPLLPPSVNEPGPGFAVARNPKPEGRSPKCERPSAASDAMPSPAARGRSAGCQTGGVAGFQVGRPRDDAQPAGLETCDAAASAVCATSSGSPNGAESPFRNSDFEFPSDFGFRLSDFPRPSIRVPLTRVKGLTERTAQRILAERARGVFTSVADFYRRVAPQPEELEAMIRVGAFDEFGATRTAQFWEAQWLVRAYGHQREGGQGWLFGNSETRNPKSEGKPKPEIRTDNRGGSAGCQTPVRCDGPDCRSPKTPATVASGQLKAPTGHTHTPPTAGRPAGLATCDPADWAVCAPARGWPDDADSSFRDSDFEFRISNFHALQEPTRRERLAAENELLGFPASGHPLELHDNVAWETYCPVARLGEHVGATVVTCGLVVEQRIHHQITGEPMKFLTLADWTGMVETELFAATYKNYGLATVRYPVLEITATVEPFENGRGFSLRVVRAGKPRTRAKRN